MVSLGLQSALSVTRESMTTTRCLRLHVSYVPPAPMLILANHLAQHARQGRPMKTPTQDLRAPPEVQVSTVQQVRSCAQIV